MSVLVPSGLALIVVWLFVRLRRLQRYPAALRDLQEALRAADAGDEDRLARLLGPPEITTLVGQYTRLGLARREARRDIDIARIVFESGDGMLVTDSHGVVVRVNRAFSRITGYSATEAIGRRTTFLRSGRHDAAFYARMWARVELYGRWEGEIWNCHRNGELHPHWLVISAVMNGERQVTHYVGSYADITQRKQAEEQQRIAAVAFESQGGMLVVDAHGVILQVNKSFTESTGYRPDEVVGKEARSLKSNRHGAAFYRAMWRSIVRTGCWQGEIWDRRKNGQEYAKWLSISAVTSGDGQVTHYIGTHFDITERKQAEERIRELAFFDQLTLLPNRTLLLDRLKLAMAAGRQNGCYGALLFIDLDNFKTLNDTLGHDVGDVLLRLVAERLSACVPQGNTVARLGGDEFVVVLGELSTRHGEASDRVAAVAGAILDALKRSYRFGDIVHHCTASIGVTLFRGEQDSIDDLMKQADLAMYRSKAVGRNLVQFFDPALALAVKERMALEQDLRQAIDGQQFLLYFQAQVAGADRLVGAEVLLRWLHPLRGMVSPSTFIPLAEETGLIIPVGQWVLQAACAQLVAWASQPAKAHLMIAVNVSARQFHQANFVGQVQSALQSSGANPRRLKLELTESTLIENLEDVIDKMTTLRADGVSFSLDDFGTGYSSLSYLKRLPLNDLKIDQSFVRDVLIDPNDAAIARTIVTLAHSLGLGVIAEGVETEAQREFLAASGCLAYQGFFFGYPLPLAGFEQRFTSRDRRHDS